MKCTSGLAMPGSVFDKYFPGRRRVSPDIYSGHPGPNAIYFRPGVEEKGEEGGPSSCTGALEPRLSASCKLLAKSAEISRLTPDMTLDFAWTPFGHIFEAMKGAKGEKSNVKGNRFPAINFIVRPVYT